MKILLLGSTGSIGKNACKCLRRHRESFSVVGLAANQNDKKVVEQAKEFGVSWAYLASPHALQRARRSMPESVEIIEGADGLEQLACKTDYDIMINAIVGAAGFRPTIAALKRGKRVALANKESLVIGGELITKIIQKYKARLIPVDSEHSAILQCLNGEDRESVEQIILTASGGPFRKCKNKSMTGITVEEALDHPTWSMGEKITIDAATLMNKGFELIEAHHLFNISYDKLKVIIHPQSIIHSMVVFRDGAVMAQCGVPDMELPIQYALSYPSRLELNSPRLDLAHVGTLEFFEPDYEKFRCLKLCLDAGRSGGTLPAALNAANEIAVRSFLDKKISFDRIPELIEYALQKHVRKEADSVDIIEQADRETREQIHSLI